jgi:hypothetical protein
LDFDSKEWRGASKRLVSSSDCHAFQKRSGDTLKLAFFSVCH